VLIATAIATSGIEGMADRPGARQIGRIGNVHAHIMVVATTIAEITAVTILVGKTGTVIANMLMSGTTTVPADVNSSRAMHAVRRGGVDRMPDTDLGRRNGACTAMLGTVPGIVPGTCMVGDRLATGTVSVGITTQARGAPTALAAVSVVVTATR